MEEQELSNRVSAGEGLGDSDWLCSHPLPSTSALPIKILSLQYFLSYPFIGTLTIMYSIPPVSWSPHPFCFGYLDRCSPFSVPSWVPLPRSSCLCFHWYSHSLLVQKRKRKKEKKQRKKKVIVLLSITSFPSLCLLPPSNFFFADFSSCSHIPNQDIPFHIWSSLKSFSMDCSENRLWCLVVH